jgi:hypothetical protein
MAPGIGVPQLAFGTYADEKKRCQNADAYWSLLHVTVCLPRSPCSRFMRQRLGNTCHKELTEDFYGKSAATLSTPA